MRHSADAETVNRLSSLSKERDAEVMRPQESCRSNASAANLEGVGLGLGLGLGLGIGLKGQDNEVTEQDNEVTQLRAKLSEG
eukprot:16448108-Heterocapsa_arctica.AAC.1